MIEVRKLRKVYPGGFAAVKDVDFDVRAGEVFGLNAGEAGRLALGDVVCRLEGRKLVVVAPVDVGKIGRQVRDVDTFRHRRVDTGVLVGAVPLGDLADSGDTAVPVGGSGDRLDRQVPRRHGRRRYRPLAIRSGSTAV